MKWETPNIIALIFAITISLLLLSTVYGSLIKGIIISDVKSNLVAGVVGSIITLLAQILTKNKKK